MSEGIDRELTSFLSRTAPFSAATPAELAEFASTLRSFRFSAGAQIYQEGDAAAAGWIVHSGTVRIMNFLPPSSLYMIERLGPGDIFGLYCRFGEKRSHHVCSAVAETDVSALRIPDAAFERIYASSCPVARATCRLCMSRLRAMQSMVGFGRLGVRQRVVRTLLGLKTAGSDRIPLTRHSLALAVGAAPETVFRALGELRRLGLVETNRGTVRLLDAKRLQKEFT